MTCIANDYAYDDVFARQVEATRGARRLRRGVFDERSVRERRRPAAAARRAGRPQSCSPGATARRGRRACRRGPLRAVDDDRADPGDARAPPHLISEGIDAWAAAVKERVLHMIGNSHIDPVWLWQWPEGYQAVRATFRSALDRMNEYPEFIFTCDSAAYYEWIEEIEPAMFEEIRARVAEGRWEIVGGWWVEPDCNIPAGESFVRHALVSQRYFQRGSAGSRPSATTSTRSGTTACLPQLLRRAGMDSYVFMRPGPHDIRCPPRSSGGNRPTAPRCRRCACRTSTARRTRISATTSTS